MTGTMSAGHWGASGATAQWGNRQAPSGPVVEMPPEKGYFLPGTAQIRLYLQFFHLFCTKNDDFLSRVWYTYAIGARTTAPDRISSLWGKELTAV